MSSLLSIYFATMTGNAESLAQRAEKRAIAEGWPVRLRNLSDIMPADLTGDELAFFIVSTWGDGEPPGDAMDFFDALCGKNPPALAQLRYAVLGLGDSGYADFNAFGRNLDARLATLGATPLRTRTEADLDFEDVYPAWADNVFSLITPLRQTTR